MVVGDRLKQIREEKELSQGDIEKATGLLRCYISRVENGHTIPAVETLEKMARALGIPLWQIFHDGVDVDKSEPLVYKKQSRKPKLDRKSENALRVIARNVTSMSARDRGILVRLSSQFARRDAA